MIVEQASQPPTNQTLKPAAERVSWAQTATVGLLFTVALINYVDRQSLSVVAPRFQQQLQLSDQGYGHIVSLFLLASTFAYAGSGWVSDLLGTRWSMALFVGWWSLAEGATAFAGTVAQLAIARFCLGLGEPGLWVAAPKAVGETFPRERRSLAISIYTLGATVGAVVAIPTIALVILHLPWRSIFLIDGATGLLWLPFWLLVYKGRTAPTQTENAGTFRDVLRRSTTWKLMLARGLTDPVWYFYLFWFPKYLLSSRHLSLPQLSRVAWIVYLAAGVGTLLGGFAGGLWIRRGTQPLLAYRHVMLIAAVLVPLSPLVTVVPNAGLAVATASVIALAHMAWLVSLTSSLIEHFPAGQVGRAAGLVAAGSGLGGTISAELIGHLVLREGYAPVFAAMAILHPLALFILWKSFRPSPASSAGILAPMPVRDAP